MNKQFVSSVPFSQREIPPPVLHELDLGGHLLVIRADKSIELFDLCDEALSRVDKATALDREETYRLFISLKELYQ